MRVYKVAETDTRKLDVLVNIALANRDEILVPHYSTRWADTGLLVEREVGGAYLALAPAPDMCWTAMWGARFYAVADSPRLAIVIAFLLASGVDVDTELAKER